MIYPVVKPNRGDVSCGVGKLQGRLVHIVAADGKAATVLVAKLECSRKTLRSVKINFYVLIEVFLCAHL